MSQEGDAAEHRPPAGETRRESVITKPVPVDVDTENEDSLVVAGFTACGVDLADPVTLVLPLRDPVVVALADGMGGHAAGDVASAHAVRTLAATPPKDAAQVETVLHRIDDDLTSGCQDNPELRGMGTTIAGVLIGPRGRDNITIVLVESESD